MIAEQAHKPAVAERRIVTLDGGRFEAAIPQRGEQLNFGPSNTGLIAGSLGEPRTFGGTVSKRF